MPEGEAPETPEAPVDEGDDEPAAAAAEDFGSLTVVELKALLRERGLPVSGRKAELVARLEGGQ